MEIRDALASLALSETPDVTWAAAALLAAASKVLSEAIGKGAAGEAILATVRQAVAARRH